MYPTDLRGRATVPPRPKGHDLDVVAQFYEERSSQPRVQILQHVMHTALDQMLDDRGYERSEETLVMAADLRTFDGGVGGKDFSVVSDVSGAEWFDRVTQGGVPGVHPSAVMVTGIPATFITLEDKGEFLGCGRAAVHAGRLGLFNLFTVPERRGHGVATALLRDLIVWGVTQGATNAYLQVDLDNIDAIRLYRSLRFRRCYTYWYRFRNLG